MKKEPKLRFPEFSGEWREKKVGDIGSIFGGGTPSTAKTDYWKGTIPWISSADLNEENFSFIANRFITKDAIRNSATNLIPSDSIQVVTRVGVGKVAVSKYDICTSQDFQSIYNITENVIFVALIIKNSMEKIKKQSQGTTIKGITKNDLSNLKVSIPSLPEQQKIADFLSTIDSQLETKEQEIENLEEMKKGFMQKIFSQEMRFKDEKGEEYPEWEEKKLGEIVEAKNGYAFSSKDYVATGKYRIITIGNVTGGAYVDLRNTNYVECLPGNIAQHQILEKYDILVTLTGNVGRVSLCNANDALLNQRVGLIKERPSIDKYFLLQILKTGDFEKSMIEKGQGAAQLNISLTDIESYNVKLPHLSEQQKIANFFSLFDEKIEIEKEIFETLKEIKKGLLQQMFV